MNAATNNAPAIARNIVATIEAAGLDPKVDAWENEPAIAAVFSGLGDTPLCTAVFDLVLAKLYGI